MRNGASRRDCLKMAGVGIGAWIGSNLLGGYARGAQSEAEANDVALPTPPAGSLRVAHLTDFHVQPELHANVGMAKCLHHVQSLKDKPDFIFNTGDCVMETLHQPRPRAQVLWDVWRKVLKDECSLRMESCLGNHDIWGWSHSSGTTGKEPGWGKQWAMDELGLAKPYHSFDVGAWHFIMLDSMQPAQAVWETRLDEEQFAWLEADLKATNKPVMIGSHVPIMSPATLLDGGRIGGTPEAPALAARRCHLDVKRIGQLFAKHPNVKVCVSGHLHQIDRAEYRGVTYLCNPAVCGDWWKGPNLGIFSESYTVLDLHPDGKFDSQYVPYGWKADPAAATQPTPAA